MRLGSRNILATSLQSHSVTWQSCVLDSKAGAVMMRRDGDEQPPYASVEATSVSTMPFTQTSPSIRVADLCHEIGL